MMPMPPVPSVPVENKEALPQPPEHVPMPEVAPVAAKKPKMLTVRAKRDGFFKNVRRKEGDVFQVEESKLGSWMEKV